MKQWMEAGRRRTKAEMKKRQYPCVGELVTLSSLSIQSKDEGGGVRERGLGVKSTQVGFWGVGVSHDRTLPRLINNSRAHRKGGREWFYRRNEPQLHIGLSLGQISQVCCVWAAGGAERGRHGTQQLCCRRSRRRQRSGLMRVTVDGDPSVCRGSSFRQGSTVTHDPPASSNQLRCKFDQKILIFVEIICVDYVIFNKNTQITVISLKKASVKV